MIGVAAATDGVAGADGFCGQSHCAHPLTARLVVADGAPPLGEWPLGEWPLGEGPLGEWPLGEGRSEAIRPPARCERGERQDHLEVVQGGHD